MKKIIVYLACLLFSVQVWSQSSPALNLRIANMTTAIGQNLPIGSTIRVVSDSTKWVSVKAVLSTATINSALADTSFIPDVTKVKGSPQIQVAGTNGHLTLTVPDATITNAKLANMATKTYKGRTSAATGVPEDVAVSTLKTDLILVKGDVGLGNVDNTSDVNKPVSTAQQTALNLKGDKTTTITTTAPLTIGGGTSADLSANRTFAIIPATPLVPGSMSAADKTKLDGIATGATAFTTANEIDPKFALDSAYLKGHVRTDLDKSITNETNISASWNPTTRIFSTADSGGAKGDTIPSQVADVITDAVTTIAPSENAVFDALSGKETAFSKNTGFNLPIGTTPGTVLEGRTFGTAANSASTDFAPASVYPATGLTTGYVPYKSATVLANSPFYTDGTNVAIELFTGISSGSFGRSLNFRPSLVQTIGDPTYLYNLSISSEDLSASGNADGLSINAFSGVSFSVGTNNRTERVRIAQNGSLGIDYFTGTQITNNKLAVNGSGYFNGAVDATSYKIANVATFLDWTRIGYAGTAGMIPVSQGISTTPIWKTVNDAIGAAKITYGGSFTFNNDLDLVPKIYVDAVASGNLPKIPVNVATTGPITLSGAQTIDAYSAVVGDRVLVWQQAAAASNGVYMVATGAWTRASDLDTWAELNKAYVAVLSGGQAGSSFVCTIPSSGTLETTAVTWVLYNVPTNILAGTGLSKIGNTINLNTATSGALGGIKAGAGITMTGDVASVSTAYDAAGAAAAITPTTLGLVIGTNVQAYNSTLTGINQALTTTSSPTFATVTANLAGSVTGSAASFTGSLAGDVTGTQGATVVGRINSVSMSGLTTGILKNTTTTGVPSIAVAADFPVLNQNTTGNALTAGSALTVTTNANLTGEVTSVGNAATLTNSAVISKVLTGYISGSGTVAATDNIIQAVQKLNGNEVAHAALTTTAHGLGASAFHADSYFLTPAGSAAALTSFPTLNQNTTGTAANVTGIVVGANGGTGVANTGKTITLGGNLTTSGVFASTFTMTGTTNVTFPTTGTLATTAQITGANSGTNTGDVPYYEQAFEEFATGVQGQNNLLTYTPKAGYAVTVSLNGSDIPESKYTVTTATKIVKIIIPVYQFDQIIVKYFAN